ncbi:MAG TPA: TonB-dependent receptor [Terriglobia bacterium]|nr:TonB-dependent receptor [Terriglobia bacterium]
MPACFKTTLAVFLLAAWIALAPSSGTAAALLSGVVADASGARVAGATIKLFAATALLRSTQSGPDGTFSLAALPPGDYLVEVSAPGLQKQSRRVKVDASGLELDIQMEIAGLHQDVTVVSSDRPEVPTEVARVVSLLDSQEIENRNLVLVSDAVLSVPALQVQQSGGPGRLAAFRFRGLRPEDTAILYDGFRLLDPSDNKGSARPLLADLLVADAERLEILRGAGSTLYGTHSMGGLINMISRQPSEPLRGSWSVEGGSLGLFQSSASLEGLTPGRQFSYGLHATHLNYTRGLDEHDDYRNTTGSGRVTYDPTPQIRLFGRFSLTDSFALLDEGPSPVAGLSALPVVREAVAHPHPGANFYPQLDDPDYRQANRLVLAAFRLDHWATARWSHSLSFHSLRTRRRYEDGPAVSPLSARLGGSDFYDLQRFEGGLDELLWRNALQIHPASTLSFALGWDRTSLDQSSFGQAIEAVQNSFALQVSNHTRLLDSRLQIQVAGRAQSYRLRRPEFSDDAGNPYGGVSDIDAPATYSGDLALSYFFPAAGTKLRVHGGNGFRSPSLYERFGSGGGGSYYGFPLLNAERSGFVDGGIDQYLFGQRLEVGLTYFYTHLQTYIDFVSVSNDPFGRLFGYANRHGGNARGVEITAAARPSPALEIATSYTYTNSDQVSPTSAGTTRFLGLSDHQFTLGVSLRPARRLSLHWQTYAVSQHDVPLFGSHPPFPFGTYRFPGYVRADLTGSYLLRDGERSQVRLHMRVDNLFDREYYHGGFLAPGATLRAGLRWEF